MDTSKIDFDMVEGMRSVTWEVTLKRQTEMQARMWVATILLRLAAWILNTNIEIEMVEDE